MEPMVRVRVLRDFYDRQADNILRKAGEEYETFCSRARELASRLFVEIIRELNIHEIPEDDAASEEEQAMESDQLKEESDPEE